MGLTVVKYVILIEISSSTELLKNVGLTEEVELESKKMTQELKARYENIINSNRLPSQEFWIESGSIYFTNYNEDIEFKLFEGKLELYFVNNGKLLSCNPFENISFLRRI